jgi:hypothetical protein
MRSAWHSPLGVPRSRKSSKSPVSSKEPTPTQPKQKD